MTKQEITESSTMFLRAMNGEVDNVDDYFKELITKQYKRALDNGYYITVKKGTEKIILSNKFEEKNRKQLENFDNFIENLFITEWQKNSVSR